MHRETNCTTLQMQSWKKMTKFQLLVEDFEAHIGLEMLDLATLPSVENSKKNTNSKILL